METFDGDNVIAKFKEDCKFYCCICVSIYIHNLPAIDRLSFWCLKKIESRFCVFFFFFLV